MADLRVTALASAFDHKTLIAIEDAVRAYAGILAPLGSTHPDLAADAERLHDLRLLFLEAAGARMILADEGKVAT